MSELGSVRRRRAVGKGATTDVESAVTGAKREKIASETANEIRDLRGSPTRFYWSLTVIFILVTLALLYYGFVVNLRGVSGDTASLQLLVTVIGVITSVASTIAITRALVRPSPAVARFAKDKKDYARSLRNHTFDLLTFLERARECDNVDVRKERFSQLADRVAELTQMANRNVQKWFIVEQACQDRNDGLEDDLADFQEHREEKRRAKSTSRSMDEDDAVTVRVGKPMRAGAEAEKFLVDYTEGSPTGNVS